MENSSRQTNSSRLPESILVQTVTGEYTDVHEELIGPMDTDMMLQPDETTLRLVPWAAVSRQLLCPV